MGFCSRRIMFLSNCLLQIMLVIERQAFDFLGFLWIPILVNFFEVVFLILGFFGTYQYRSKYIISYVAWQIFWLGWNVFMMCLYLDVAGLDHRTNKVLKLDSNSESWWSNEGPGCKKIVPLTDEPWQANVENCLVNYVHIEIFQAGSQCLLSIIGVVIGTCLSRSYLDQDDTLSHKSTLSSRSKNQKRMSLYSIEFNSQMEANDEDDDDADSDVSNEYGSNQDHLAQPVSPKPMTPRRVKRRSVMTRGSISGRHSTSKRPHPHHNSPTTNNNNTNRVHNATTLRNSTYRRGLLTNRNPVTKLLEQKQHHLKMPTYADNPSSPSPPIYNYYANDVNSYSHSLHYPQQHQSQPSIRGHMNPTYQQTSRYSLNDSTEELDDLYNNRPASVRSSYSNFHGARPLRNSSENSKSSSMYYEHQQRHPNNLATAQVPAGYKRYSHPNRNSIRSMAFFNSGPPAYSSQGQTSADSETTI